MKRPRLMAKDGIAAPREPDVLVEAAQGGDREAFAALVEEHAPAVYRIAYRLTHRRHDADDVVQETFLRAHRELHRFRGGSAFATWVHRIAVRCSYDLLRAAGRQPETVGDSQEEAERWLGSLTSPLPSPERAAEAAEVQRQLDRALEELTPMERTAFVLRHVEGHSVAEIADVLEVSVGATKQAVFRAISKLRSRLPAPEGPR